MTNGSGPGLPQRPRPPVTWQQVALFGLLCLTGVAMAWACAWGVRG